MSELAAKTTTHQEMRLPAKQSNQWLETKKRKKVEKREEHPPSLPLDWTKVKRRREGCCPPAMKILDEESIDPLRQRLVEGLGIMCLHESDPSWFQGYFFPNMRSDNLISQDAQTLDATNTTQIPWGVLAVQEELDDCLKCADGGFRRVTLTVFEYPEKRKESIQSVEWTGGDMMRLMGEKACLEPHLLLTGKRAVPQVERLFKELINKCRKNLSAGEPSSVLDLIPDVAIIAGPMKLVLRKKSNDDLGI